MSLTPASIPSGPHAERHQPIFAPLNFRNLTVPNRLFRSSISGRIDYYNGAGSPARVAFEEKFARGGVGAIISSHVPIRVDSRVLPNYAMIDCDERIPFWHTVGEHVHRHGSKFILQLSMSGRQQDIGGIENHPRRTPPGVTEKRDGFHGLPSRAMSEAEIAQAVKDFGKAAWRAKEAGLDGVELHSSNGYLFTQFISSAINDRQDRYGGDIEKRATFLREVIQSIREQVGNDFFLGAKVSLREADNAIYPWPLYLFKSEGNTLEESIAGARAALLDGPADAQGKPRWRGVDALHVSVGSTFPHPLNPAGPFPVEMGWRTYQSVIASSDPQSWISKSFLNYLLMRYNFLRWIFRFAWQRTQKEFLDRRGRAIPGKVEGLNVPLAARLAADLKNDPLRVPIIVTGGFQTGEGILKALAAGCDAVSIARPLLANPNLPQWLAAGHNCAPRPCSYCNQCLLNVLENPLGCYDLDRYDGDYDQMLANIMDIFPAKVTSGSSPDPWLP